MAETVIVSACLVGIRSRYNGADSLDEKLIKQLEECNVVPLCPEQLGGLATPRAAAEICGGDGSKVLIGLAGVRNVAGEDLTAHFVRGAEEALKIARLTGAKRAFLKEKSPSCGVKLIKREGVEAAGSGVLAALFSKEGIEISGI